MKLAEKAKVYDEIRKHIINAENELGRPPKMSIPYLPDMGDDDAIRGFHKHLKDSAVEHAEWCAREKEISRVRHIFENIGEDMSRVEIYKVYFWL